MTHHHLESSRWLIGSFKQLKQFHAQMIHLSLHTHNYWVTVLLSHCSRLGAPLPYARHLFHSLPHPNAHAFTAMLHFYSRLAAHHHVIALFRLMRALCVAPDAFVFPLLIRSAAHSAPSVHSFVIKSGSAADLYVRNSIMDGYAKTGPIETARQLFDEMPERTVADWNSIISGYWRCGDEAAACRTFGMMPEPNVVSWTAMVSGYSKMGELDKAREYFETMPKRTVVSWNAMLSGYSQNGLTQEVLELFTRMMDSGEQPDETTWVTVVSSCSAKGDIKMAEALVGFLEKRRVQLNYFVKTALLDMYAKCGNLPKARKIFEEMHDRNLVSWNAMISGYARVGDLDTARELFDKMPERNVVSWNSMISGMVQNMQWVEAIAFFKDMVNAEGIKPDEVTMVSVISACGHLGALETGKWLLKLVEGHDIKPSLSMYNALIFMYSRCGSLDLAKRVFDEMPKRSIFSYNSLITGLAIQGRAAEAIELMEKMEQVGIRPDRITYIGVLTSCSHSRWLDEGRRIFKRIEAPTVDHYACMVDLLGRAGRLDEVKRLIDDMPMEPHSGIYGSLLNASRIHRRVDLGEFAAQKLFTLEPSNSGNYILLANIYASAKRWNDVERVRSMMKQRGVRKISGNSWMELGGKVVRFVAGDRLHHQADKIHLRLESLMNKMKAMGYVADGNCVLRDVEEEEKEEMVEVHSEKLAVAYALLVTEAGSAIRVVKNLRICEDCHIFMKMASKLEGREILVRDNNRFHSFKDGECSCYDCW